MSQALGVVRQLSKQRIMSGFSCLVPRIVNSRITMNKLLCGLVWVSYLILNNSSSQANRLMPSLPAASATVLSD
jgi:hypothetical protein